MAGSYLKSAIFDAFSICSCSMFDGGNEPQELIQICKKHAPRSTKR